jgi:hypothetical protein
MLPYPRENAFLDVDGVSGIGILGEISVNNRLSVIAQKNPEHGFARSFVVGTIKASVALGKPTSPCLARLRKLVIALLNALRSNETELSRGYRERG